jgi:hypothetical protein
VIGRWLDIVFLGVSQLIATLVANKHEAINTMGCLIEPLFVSIALDGLVFFGGGFIRNRVGVFGLIATTRACRSAS